MPPQPRVDFQKLVSRISDQFELQNTIEVLSKARKALSEPVTSILIMLNKKYRKIIFQLNLLRILCEKY